MSESKQSGWVSTGSDPISIDLQRFDLVQWLVFLDKAKEQNDVKIIPLGAQRYQVSMKKDGMTLFTIVSDQGDFTTERRITGYQLYQPIEVDEPVAKTLFRLLTEALICFGPTETS